MAAEEPLQRAVAEAVTPLGQHRAQRLGGDSRRRVQKIPDQPSLPLDARGAAITPERTGPRIAMRPLKRAPPTDAGGADAEARRRRTVARTVRHRLHDPDAEIERERFSHARRPPSPAGTFNHNQPQRRIPNDSIR